MPIRRVQGVWSGLAGVPYLSTWYFREVESVTGPQLTTIVAAFLTGIREIYSSALTCTLSTEILRIDEVSGDAIGTLVGSPSAVAGNNLNPIEWTAKQGNLNLRTDDYVDGRRVRGRLFLPGVCGGSGEQTPTATYTTAGRDAALALVSASSALGPWVVWSRPREADPTATPPVVARPGSAHTILGGTVGSQWAVLRSRRT